MQWLLLGALCATTAAVHQHGHHARHHLHQQPLIHEQVEKRTTYSTAAIKENFPDPCFIPADVPGQNAFYAFATRNVGSTVNVQVAYTPDFDMGPWTILNSTKAPKERYDAMPKTPAWVAAQPNSNVWAPDVSKLPDGSHIMYFSATPKQDLRRHCIGVARASAALGIKGPYTPDPKPLICPLDKGGAIDPSGYLDPQTGKRYLLYKVDGNSIGRGGPCGNSVAPTVSTPLVLQPVDPKDGTTFIGQATNLLDNGGVGDDGVVEAPSLVRGPSGAYFLFFSSGCFSTPGYTVSYAVSTTDSITGPYERVAEALLQTGDRRLRAPGGATVLWQQEPSAWQRYVVLHAGPIGARSMYGGLATLSGRRVEL